MTLQDAIAEAARALESGADSDGMVLPGYAALGVVLTREAVEALLRAARYAVGVAPYGPSDLALGHHLRHAKRQPDLLSGLELALKQLAAVRTEIDLAAIRIGDVIVRAKAEAKTP